MHLLSPYQMYGTSKLQLLGWNSTVVLCSCFFYNCHSCFLMLHSPIFSVSQFRRERVIYGFFVWFSFRGKKNVKYNELTIIRQFKTHPNQMYVCGFYMISTHVFIGGTDMFFFELFSSWLLLSFSFQDPSTNSNSNINIFIKYILYIRSLLWYTWTILWAKLFDVSVCVGWLLQKTCFKADIRRRQWRE